MLPDQGGRAVPPIPMRPNEPFYRRFWQRSMESSRSGGRRLRWSIWLAVIGCMPLAWIPTVPFATKRLPKNLNSEFTRLAQLLRQGMTVCFPFSKENCHGGRSNAGGVL